MMNITAGDGAIGVVGEKPLGVLYGEQLVADFVAFANLDPLLEHDRIVVNQLDGQLRNMLSDEHGLPREIHSVTEEELTEIGQLSLNIRHLEHETEKHKEAAYRRKTEAEKRFQARCLGRGVVVEALEEGTEPIDALAPDRRGHDLLVKKRLDKVEAVAIMPQFYEKRLMLIPPKKGWLRFVSDVNQYSVKVLDDKAEPLVRISFLS